MEEFVFQKGSAFTHNGEFFALVSIDGRLRIWDTTSGKLIQEFSSASFTETSCTCLCWSRDHKTRKQKLKKEPKKKKRKLDNGIDADYHLPNLLLGTNNGSILTYNPVSGDCDKSHDTGDSKQINYICSNTDDTIYTCSNNKYISEWSSDSPERKSKWKADKISVEMVCLGPSGKTLLSAGQSIKLWNLENKELIQRFHGHSSKVSLLKFTSFSIPLSSSDTPDDGYYFISGAKEDRLISVWQINSLKEKKTPVASCLLSDVPVVVDSIVIKDDEKPLKLCAGCIDGKVHLFESAMDSETTRPIESTKTVEFKLKEKKKTKGLQPSTLHDILLTNELSLHMRIAHGSSIKPSFENLEFSQISSSHKIVQDYSKGLLAFNNNVEEDKPVETAGLSVNTQVIGNDNYTKVALKPVSEIKTDINCNEEDLQKTETLADKLSMEERLKEDVPGNSKISKSNDHNSKPSKIKPNVSSFSLMLTQALHSNDDVMLSDMLFNKCSESILTSTLKRVPTDMVGKLLSIIISKLQKNPRRSKALNVWLKVILSVHLTYIMSNVEIAKDLSTLYGLLKSQLDILPGLMNIQGKVDLLLTHSTLMRVNSSEDDEIDNPAIVFNEDSEDETDALFGKLLKDSDDEGVSDDIDFSADEASEEQYEKNVNKSNNTDLDSDHDIDQEHEKTEIYQNGYVGNSESETESESDS